jgi:hypothetical protein
MKIKSSIQNTLIFFQFNYKKRLEKICCYSFDNRTILKGAFGFKKYIINKFVDFSENKKVK